MQGRAAQQAAMSLLAAPLLLALLVHSAQAAPLRRRDGSCVMFPASHPLRQDVSKWPVYKNSSAVVATIGANKPFHADFGGGWTPDGGQKIYFGIPMTTVDTDPAKGQRFPADGAVVFDGWPEESNRGKYPFPLSAKIEGTYPGCSVDECGGDRHVLVKDNRTCQLYEGYKCRAPTSMAGKWRCSNGAVFNLSRSAGVQRPLGWTSADAAGLPIWAGLISVSEALVGKSISHAIRFTAPTVRAAYQFPATHLVDVGGPAGAGWMGMRARLRATFDCAGLQTEGAQAICRALQRTGMILADVGREWYLTGQASPQWERKLGGSYDRFMDDIRSISGRDVEVVVPPQEMGGLCLCDRSHAYNCGCPRI